MLHQIRCSIFYFKICQLTCLILFLCMMTDVFLNSDLGLVETQIWSMIEKGVSSFRAPFHYLTVATIAQDKPELRTVILRDADKQKREISFHTDARSPKVAQLKNSNTISLLFYDSENRIQLRCSGEAILHYKDARAELAWKKSRLSSQLCYTNLLPSGADLTAPELIDLSRTDVSEDELEKAYANFLVVTSKINEIDWLFLHHKGHRRARFDYIKNCFQWKQV